MAKKQKADSKKETAPQQPQEQQPLFFKEPVPILQDRHKDAGIKKDENYDFAKQTNSIPINAAEFAEIAKFYPIVFTAGEAPVPVAVLGLETNKNLFVNDKGDWDQGLYIPAYARRYPFALSNNPQNDKLMLCVDEKSPSFVKKATKKDLSFFDDNGEQTNFAKEVLKFCSQYHSDTLATSSSIGLLKYEDLLKEKNLTVNNDSLDKPLSLSGFQVIDEEALSKLSDDKILKFHKNGMLALIYFHLQSTSNWQRLVAKHENK